MEKHTLKNQTEEPASSIDDEINSMIAEYDASDSKAEFDKVCDSFKTVVDRELLELQNQPDQELLDRGLNR